MKFTRFKLQQQILLGYFIPIFALVIAALWGAWTAQQVGANFTRVSLMADMTDKTHHLQIAHLQMANGVRGQQLEPNPFYSQEFSQGEAFFRQTRQQFEQAQFSRQNLSQLFPTHEFNTIAELRQDIDRVIAGIQDEIQAYQSSRNANLNESDPVSRREREISRSFTNINEQLHQIYEDLVLSEQRLIEQSLGRLLQGLLALAIAIGGVASLIVWWIASNVTQTIARTANLMTTSTLEITGAMEQQETTANEQASSVNETTATMEELGVSSQKSSQQAKDATTAAQTALYLAEDGDRAVTDTVAAMDELKDKVAAIARQILRLREQNEKIGNISQLVSNISNQTNMLALNASVEAVRAGEYGKGFAVVANEIRKLADESQQSAKKINELVIAIQDAIRSTTVVTDEGTHTVETGLKIARKTTEAFSGVTDAVNRVVLNNQQIAANIEQQALATQQIAEAMNLLNQGEQTTAEGIAQTRQETQQLQQASVDLKALV